MADALPFAKLHGAGNAYVAIDGRTRELDLPGLARAMAAHHTGVGSDGLVVAQSPRDPQAAIRLRILNSDGSEAEMSGNGVRLFAKFVLDRGLARVGADGALVIETAAGLRRVWPEIRSGVMAAGRVGMEIPSLAPADLPMTTTRTRWIDEALDVPAAPEGRLLVTCLSLGNPHAVHVTRTPVDEFPLAEIGEQVQNHPLFPNRVNFEVVNVLGPSRLRARIYERGEGETPSSGTGSTACAVAVRVRADAARATEFPARSDRSETAREASEDSEAHTGELVRVELRGGVLSIAWKGEGSEAFLEGPTVEICRGEWRGAQVLR